MSFVFTTIIKNFGRKSNAKKWKTKYLVRFFYELKVSNAY
jgi:hypothetical protein